MKGMLSYHICSIGDNLFVVQKSRVIALIGVAGMDDRIILFGARYDQ